MVLAAYADVSMAAADSSVYFPLSLPVASARPLARRSMMDLRSLSIFNLTMQTCSERNALVKKDPRPGKHDAEGFK